MRGTNPNSEANVKPAVLGLSANTAADAVSPTLAYREWAEVPVQEEDLIEQLRHNLSQLQESQARLKFMLREVAYLLKV